MIDDIIDSGVKYAVTTPNLAQLKVIYLLTKLIKVSE